MFGGRIETLIDELFDNQQFSLRLQDRVANVLAITMQQIDKDVLQRKGQIQQARPQALFQVSNLVQDIGDTMQQLVDIGLKGSLSSEFAYFSQDTLRVRGELQQLRSELLRDLSNQKEQIEQLQKAVQDLKKKSELRTGVQRIDSTLKSRLSRTWDTDSPIKPGAPNEQTKEMSSLKQHVAELQANIRQNQLSHMKLHEDISMSLKTKLEQNYQKLKKDIITLTTRCDSLGADRELFNQERLEKAVKRQIDSRLQPIVESVDEHRRFFSCYQQQFSDLQRSVKKFLECSLETIWKVITEIRFQLEQLPYRQEEAAQEGEKKPQATSAFSFLFG